MWRWLSLMGPVVSGRASAWSKDAVQQRACYILVQHTLPSQHKVSAEFGNMFRSILSGLSSWRAHTLPEPWSGVVHCAGCCNLCETLSWGNTQDSVQQRLCREKETELQGRKYTVQCEPGSAEEYQCVCALINKLHKLFRKSSSKRLWSPDDPDMRSPEWAADWYMQRKRG